MTTPNGVLLPWFVHPSPKGYSAFFPKRGVNIKRRALKVNIFEQNHNNRNPELTYQVQDVSMQHRKNPCKVKKVEKDRQSVFAE